MPSTEAIGKIVLERFRVFRERTALNIGRLTLLAGANSSGKSSAMLPVLLLKQTLDAPFDPGALLLTGGHAAIDSFDELRSHGARGDIVLGIQTTEHREIEMSFRRDAKGEISVAAMRSRGAKGPAVELVPGTEWRGRPVGRRRFLLGTRYPRSGEVLVNFSAARAIRVLDHVLHVPGLRSPPLRDYPVTAVGDTFAGRFDPYVASLLLEWQRAGDSRLKQVANDLLKLGLTWKVHPKKISDTHVSIEVGRLPRSTRGGAHDVVDMADVGVGVSQALPVIGALRQAARGHLVYIEQPELHLHPNAQRIMASMLVDAARRGVRVVAETHSSLLLLGIQEAVARGVPKLAPADVQLHWFTRNPKTGDVEVASRSLDVKGAFDDWPADFDSVELAAHAAYLDAVEAKQR
jgi:predicted ATPase